MSRFQTVACVMDQRNRFCNSWSLLKMNCSVHMSLFALIRTGETRLLLFEHSCFLDFRCLHQDINLPLLMRMRRHFACCTSSKKNSMPSRYHFIGLFESHLYNTTCN